MRSSEIGNFWEQRDRSYSIVIAQSPFCSSCTGRWSAPNLFRGRCPVSWNTYRITRTQVCFRNVASLYKGQPGKRCLNFFIPKWNENKNPISKNDTFLHAYIHSSFIDFGCFCVSWLRKCPYSLSLAHRSHVSSFSEVLGPVRRQWTLSSLVFMLLLLWIWHRSPD